MGKAHYSILDDMEKYNPNFNRKQYEDREEDEVKAEFKEYYAKRLPIDLLTWCRVNEPSDNMIYKQGYWDQIVFIRDIINHLFYKDYDELKENPVMVINTHTSKSIVLPVYEINLKKYGVKMILRNNFYDWKISVESDNWLILDFKGLFKETEVYDSRYCEGFEENKLFGSYSDNKKQFLLELDDRYAVYTFMFLLNNYLAKASK